MKIRFYKDTLSKEQIIDLLALDDNFKIDGEPIIEYQNHIPNYDQWYDDSGSFNVYKNENSKKNKTPNNYIRLYPYTKFNEAQIALYEKFITENYGVKICHYYVLNSDKDKEYVLQKIGKFPELDYEYPFIVGKEGEHIFVLEKIIESTYYSHDEKIIYKYLQQSIE